MRKIFSIVGGLLLLGIGVFVYQNYYQDNNYPSKPKVVKNSNRIRTIIDEKDIGLDIYYLIKQDNGADIRIDHVYYYDVVAPDYSSENYIRFTDKDRELVGLYNDKGQVVIEPIYSGLTKVHNGMLYALKGAVKDNIGRNGDRHNVHLGGDTYLLNTKGEVLIEDMLEPHIDLDMFSLKITDEPLEDSYYVNLKGVNGKYHNFVQLEKYLQHFTEQVFLPSTEGSKWEKYLSDNLKVNLEVENDNIGDYIVIDKKELLEDKRELITQAFDLVRAGDSSRYHIDYYIEDRVITDDTEITSEQDRQLYLDEEGKWRSADFPVFSVNIKEIKGKQKRSNHFDFYRNKEGGMTLYQITIRTHYF